MATTFRSWLDDAMDRTPNDNQLGLCESSPAIRVQSNHESSLRRRLGRVTGGWTSAHFPPPGLCISPSLSLEPILRLPDAAAQQLCLQAHTDRIQQQYHYQQQQLKQQQQQQQQQQVEDDDDHDTPFTQPPSPSTVSASASDRSPSLHSNEWDVRSHGTKLLNDSSLTRYPSPPPLSSAVLPAPTPSITAAPLLSSSASPTLASSLYLVNERSDYVESVLDELENFHPFDPWELSPYCLPAMPPGPQAVVATPERFRCYDEQLDDFRLPPAAIDSVEPSTLSSPDHHVDADCSDSDDDEKLSPCHTDSTTNTSTDSDMRRITWFHINCQH